MKLYKISLLTLGAALTFTACDGMDDMVYEGGSLTTEQMNETVAAVSERVDATFSGMYNMMGEASSVFTSSSRADDFGFIMAAISLSLEGGDAFGADNGYNWFSTASELSDRNPDYANPYIRYKVPYNQLGMANDVINQIGEDTEVKEAQYKVAQAKALRAFDYLSLAPYFQGSYETCKDKPCIPVLTAGVDYANNPRATVAEVYEVILQDLTWAIEHLEGFKRTSKHMVDLNVAYGLRARANLYMGNWAEAAADAAKAMEGYTPAAINEVNKPAFCRIDEHNWIWGILITEDMGSSYGYRTSASWTSAFTGNGYGPATDNVPQINKILYDKIPSTDVRKGWWLDENLHSPNLEGVQWITDGVVMAEGDGIATYADANGDKHAYTAYTNVKFGMKTGAGSVTNANDWPLMRVEEMILIQAEGLLKSGDEAQARTVLENFVKTYRDPSYNSNASGRSLADEIWFQRRVELWMEGFSVVDTRRLNKPFVRFHLGADGKPAPTNVPAAFMFNIKADDPWLNMRFPTTETDTNAGIVNNEGGSQPVSEQNPELKDGVTD